MTASSPPFPPSRSTHSSAFELLHPQLWVTLKQSGAEQNLVEEEPVAEGHEMEKYARMLCRGSRYGLWGAVEGAVRGAEDATSEFIESTEAVVGGVPAANVAV